MNKHFASVADTEEKRTSFREIGRGCYAFTAEGDPNTGVVIGNDFVLVVDAQPTPVMANRVIEEIRKVTDKPIKHVVLTHYHAVRALGASAYGASEIISSDLTRRLIEERGEADWRVQRDRFPRLFKDAASIPGLTRPTLSFASSLSIDLGNKEVRLMHLGRGHTMGDAVVWVPDAMVMFTGDLVCHKAACYCGDAHLSDWPRALDRIAAFRPRAVMPGRGGALVGEEKVTEAIADCRRFIETLRDTASDAVHAGKGLKDTFLAVRAVMDPLYSDYAIYEHCLPFNVARAYDEAQGLDMPQLWTSERDRDLWDALGDVAGEMPEAGDELVEVEIDEMLLEDALGSALEDSLDMRDGDPEEEAADSEVSKSVEDGTESTAETAVASGEDAEIGAEEGERPAS
ncbi:MBL fold metallo-hydrolase [Labrenzia suaedae]|uniref:MBL fold metallo-hydrolase n=1 Tax=Roseibium litorale TaxID=2803841 RepID=A0ABR9CPM0_9HYPH|nr:MBL fold metallo-hydrolase [Roseibium litorale]